MTVLMFYHRSIILYAVPSSGFDCDINFIYIERLVVRTVYGNSKCFQVKVGMHQGSALSPLLFVIVIEP